MTHPVSSTNEFIAGVNIEHDAAILDDRLDVASPHRLHDRRYRVSRISPLLREYVHLDDLIGRPEEERVAVKHEDGLVRVRVHHRCGHSGVGGDRVLHRCGQYCVCESMYVLVTQVEC